MNYLFSLPHIHSVSKSFPVSQPRWLFELISSRYQLCLSHPAEQHRLLWGCVTLTAPKIPGCSWGLHCTGCCRVREVRRQPELWFVLGVPTTSWRSCPIVSLCRSAAEGGVESTVKKLVGIFKPRSAPLLPVLKLYPSRNHRIWSLSDVNLQLWSWKPSVELGVESSIA